MELIILIVIVAVVINRKNKRPAQRDEDDGRIAYTPYQKKWNDYFNNRDKEEEHQTAQWERVILQDGSEFYKLVNSSTYGYNNLPYRKKNILTKTEYEFWKMLKQKCAPYNIIICPKVRMEDFIDVNVQDYKTKQSFRGKIKSRHIDFMLCDTELNIIAGLELDDYTHNFDRAKTTDEFKNQVFNTINVPLYRILVGRSNYTIQIDEMLKDIQAKQNNVTRFQMRG